MIPTERIYTLNEDIAQSCSFYIEMKTLEVRCQTARSVFTNTMNCLHSPFFFFLSFLSLEINSNQHRPLCTSGDMLRNLRGRHEGRMAVT